jgi:hypothetical protein
MRAKRTGIIRQYRAQLQPLALTGILTVLCCCLQLQRAIEKIMVSDGEMYAKLQAGLKGIHSLARETDRLTVARDVTGATCINQYVVVKTLGRGSYGKVKLCLNTLDGQLYAIKVCAACGVSGG